MFFQPRHGVHWKQYVHRCSKTCSQPPYALPNRSYALTKSGCSFCRILHWKRRVNRCSKTRSPSLYALPTTVYAPQPKLCPSQIGVFFLPHPSLKTARTPLFDDALPTWSYAPPKSRCSFCRTLHWKRHVHRCSTTRSPPEAMPLPNRSVLSAAPFTLLPNFICLNTRSLCLDISLCASLISRPS